MSLISFPEVDLQANQSPKNLDNPVIIVGMPRSGSTIFTRLLNESPDLLVLNDFYYLQHAESIEALVNTDQDISAKLIAYIRKMISIRIERADSKGIASGVNLSESQELAISDFIDNYSPDNSENWATILQTIMSQSVSSGENKMWGYNTPQDYLNIGLLQDKFPKAKFIFVMREPKSVLASYRNVFKGVDNNNDRRRYHPILQSLAWQASAKTFLKFKEENPNRFLLVRYEDLVNQTNTTLSEVGSFLDVSFPPLDVRNFANNSSFNNNDHQDLSDTEIWLSEKCISQEMSDLGYQPSNTKPRLQDLGIMTMISLRVFIYYLSQVTTSTDVRIRVLKLIKKLTSK